MSVYMTEEEQLAAIKAWWKTNQNWISTIALIALLLLSGFKYWYWRNAKLTHMASQQYEQLMMIAATEEQGNLEAHAKSLIQSFPNLVYADAAKLVLAKQYVSQDKLDLAKEMLTSLSDSGRMSALKEVAKLRLARILIAEQSYSNAQKVLESMQSVTYQPTIDELKGDIFLALGDTKSAQKIYQSALDEVKIRGLSSGLLKIKLSQFEGNSIGHSEDSSDDLDGAEV